LNSIVIYVLCSFILYFFRSELLDKFLIIPQHSYLYNKIKNKPNRNHLFILVYFQYVAITLKFYGWVIKVSRSVKKRFQSCFNGIFIDLLVQFLIWTQLFAQIVTTKMTNWLFKFSFFLPCWLFDVEWKAENRKLSQFRKMNFTQSQACSSSASLLSLSSLFVSIHMWKMTFCWDESI
jgi:hypothetical protein